MRALGELQMSVVRPSLVLALSIFRVLRYHARPPQHPHPDQPLHYHGIAGKVTTGMLRYVVGIPFT